MELLRKKILEISKNKCKMFTLQHLKNYIYIYIINIIKIISWTPKIEDIYFRIRFIFTLKQGKYIFLIQSKIEDICSATIFKKII